MQPGSDCCSTTTVAKKIFLDTNQIEVPRGGAQRHHGLDQENFTIPNKLGIIRGFQLRSAPPLLRASGRSVAALFLLIGWAAKPSLSRSDATGFVKTRRTEMP